MRYLDRGAAVIGGASVAAALVVGASVPVALAIGAVALAIADGGTIASTLRSARPTGRHEPEAPPLPLHADERARVARAEGAVIAIRRSIRLAHAGPLRERLDEVASSAEGVLDDLRRLAAHVTVTRQASDQLDLQQLSHDLERLARVVESSEDPEVVRDLDRSMEAVREQLRIGRRLAAARAATQARIESGGLGLQQLAAQVSEMTALASPGSSWGHGARIDELTSQVEALREGLSDAGSLSERALAIGHEGGIDDQVVP